MYICLSLTFNIISFSEVGASLRENYSGSFVNCIKKCDGSAQRLLELVVTEFPCFRDEATFDGRRVAIYKRAQILISDIWCLFEGKGLGTFGDIDSLTMFADYRVPQSLQFLGVFEYSDVSIYCRWPFIHRLTSTDYLVSRRTRVFIS